MKTNKKGFTLIEIIVCLVIISVIATISIVALVNKKDSEYDKNVKKVVNSADVYYSSNEKIQQDLVNNGGYLVLSVEQLRNLGLLENKLLVDGIDISELKDEGSNYKKVLLSNRGEGNEGVTLYYPLTGSPRNYSTTKYIYDNDLEDTQKNIDYLEENFFDKVYFYDNDFNRLNIECDGTVFSCGNLYIDNGSIKDNVDNVDNNDNDDNVNIETLKNKMLSQQIKYQNESLTKNLFIYTAPILRVYGISDNTEKVITDTDFDKWYKNVRIDIVGVADDEAYLNGRKESNLSIFKVPNLTNNLNKDEKTTSYSFNESGEYKYSYKFEASSLENTLISSYINIPEDKTIKVDNVLPVIKKINSDNGEIQYEITDDKSGISEVYCSENSSDVGKIIGNNNIYECKNKYVIAYDNAKNKNIYINEDVKSIDEDDIIIKPIENSFSKFSVTVKNYSNYKDWLNISLSLKDYNYYSYEARLNNYFNSIIKKEENNTLSFEFDLVDVLNEILYNKRYDELDLYRYMEYENKYNMFTVYVNFAWGNNVLKRYATNYSFDLTRISKYFDGEWNSYHSESEPYIVTNDYFVFQKIVYDSYDKEQYLYKVDIRDDYIGVNEIDKKLGGRYEYWYNTCYKRVNEDFGYTKVIIEKTTSKKKGNISNYYFYECTIGDKNCKYDYSSSYSSWCGNSQKFDDYDFNSFNISVDNDMSNKISFIVGKIGYMEKKSGCVNCGRYSFSLNSQLLEGKLFIIKNENIDYGIYFVRHHELRSCNDHLYYVKFKLTPTVNKVAI